MLIALRPPSTRARPWRGSSTLGAGRPRPGRWRLRGRGPGGPRSRDGKSGRDRGGPRPGFGCGTDHKRTPGTPTPMCHSRSRIANGGDHPASGDTPRRHVLRSRGAKAQLIAIATLLVATRTPDQPSGTTMPTINEGWLLVPEPSSFVKKSSLSAMSIRNSTRAMSSSSM